MITMRSGNLYPSMCCLQLFDDDDDDDDTDDANRKQRRHRHKGQANSR